METSVWFENGTLNKKRSNLQAMTACQPVLRFRTIFTERSWSTDPFVLFQNSIRHEIQDLYIMLRAAAYRLDGLQVSDCQALLKWLVEFGQLVTMYLTVCENVIYPTVLRRQKETCLSVTDLTRRTKGLVDELVGIHREALAFVGVCQARDDTSRINFDNATLQQALQKVCSLSFEFVARLEEFFEWELQVVASIVEKCLSREQAREIENKAIVDLVRYEVGEFVWGAVAQWIPPGIKEAYLRSVDMTKALRLRRKERKWMRAHKSLQMEFAKR